MATEIKLPDLGDNVASAVVVGVMVKEGDGLEAGQPFLELETDKAVVEVPAPSAGVVEKILVKPGDEVKSGQVVLLLGRAAVPATKTEPSKPAEAAPKASVPATLPAAAPVPTPAPTAAPVSRKLIPAAPSVRRLARELGIDLLQVPGSGPAHRISENDVRSFAGGAPAIAPGVSAAAPSPALPDFSKWGPVRREAMSGIRRATVRSMAQAWSSVPMVTHFDKADITGLEAARKRHAKKAEDKGAKLTTTAILLKVLATALKLFPRFNASLDTSSNEVIFKDYVHLGVAVDTQTGLLVPVIRDADKKGIIELAAELGALAAKARDRKLTPDEMQGACFSLSNLGGIGGTGFTPIVNWPEVAIMGVSRSATEPVWNAEKNTFEPRLMMPFSLTYDQRLIDGADAARFCRFVADALEDPLVMSL